MKANKKNITIIAHKRLREFAAALCEKHNIKKRNSKILVDNLIEANLMGIDTHGISRLAIYLKRIKLGLIDPKAKMEFEQFLPVAARLNANNGIGQVAGVKAVNYGIKLAKTFGAGIVAVSNSQHFGALSHYCNLAARKGFLSLAFTNAEPAMPPFGSYQAYFGTNPIAMGIPVRGSDPILIDLSTSIAARGNIISAAKRGEDIPDNWAVDSEGNPTTDAEKALAGAVLTMAGAKGYALALLVDIFSGVLSGSGFGRNVNSMYKDLEHTANVGHFFMIFNINAFMPKNEFYERITEMKNEIKNSYKRHGVKEIRLPGERKFRVREERLRKGIPVGKEVIKELKELAAANDCNRTLT